MKKTIIIPGVILLSLTSCTLPSQMETFYGSGDVTKSGVTASTGTQITIKTTTGSETTKTPRNNPNRDDGAKPETTEIEYTENDSASGEVNATLSEIDSLLLGEWKEEKKNTTTEEVKPAQESIMEATPSQTNAIPTTSEALPMVKQGQ